jgi:hypothetical protein
MEDRERQGNLAEYEQIRNLRGLWSGAIMDWMKVGVPVGGALFGFFSFLSTTTLDNWKYSWLLPILGWLIFVIPMILWRVVAHHIDQQIVEMYPRMLELEEKLGWVTHATYYYHNLSCKGKKLVKQKLGSLPRDYREYERTKKVGGSYQQMLDIWDSLGLKSMGSRGHVPQDTAVGFTGIVTLAIACLIAWSLTCPQNHLWVIVSGGILAITVIAMTFVTTLRLWP